MMINHMVGLAFFHAGLADIDDRNSDITTQITVETHSNRLAGSSIIPLVSSGRIKSGLAFMI
jgi:hypothetical protein